jgi:hypothetical protein
MSLRIYFDELSREYECNRMEHLYIELAREMWLHGNHEYMIEILKPLQLDEKYIRSLIPKRV